MEIQNSLFYGEKIFATVMLRVIRSSKAKMSNIRKISAKYPESVCGNYPLRVVGRYLAPYG